RVLGRRPEGAHRDPLPRHPAQEPRRPVALRGDRRVPAERLPRAQERGDGLGAIPRIQRRQRLQAALIRRARAPTSAPARVPARSFIHDLTPRAIMKTNTTGHPLVLLTLALTGSALAQACSSGGGNTPSSSAG